MCIRGTVKSDSGHDAILVIQLIGCLCYIHLRCLDRDNGAAVICIFFTDHLYKFSVRIQFQDVFDKVSGQHHFMRKDGVLAIIFGLVMIMFVYVFTYPAYQAVQVMPALFGIVYVAVMLSFIYLTRCLPGGKFHVWLIFLCSWGCDTCAYCVGMLIGKHKMAPVLSPKKSVEGAVGGVVGAALLGIIYASVTKGPIVEYAVICAVGALISMVGDLAASAIKRNQGIKDYGKLIPGHGGILDRFDSVIFTAPVIYFLSIMMIHA